MLDVPIKLAGHKGDGDKMLGLNSSATHNLDTYDLDAADLQVMSGLCAHLLIINVWPGLRGRTSSPPLPSDWCLLCPLSLKTATSGS